MLATKGYAALTAKAALQPFSFERREVGDRDVRIEITHCGICHSDIHQARNEWGIAKFPIVPGHEIIGTVTHIGAQVTTFTVGDRAGVGCFVDSCRTCPNCLAGEEQYCDGGMSGTYNGYERDGKTPTYGGYSTQIVVDENYVLHVSDKLDLPGVAPHIRAGRVRTVAMAAPSLRYAAMTSVNSFSAIGTPARVTHPAE